MTARSAIYDSSGAEDTLRALLESSTDSIFMVDRELRLVAMNAAFVRDFRNAYGFDLMLGEGAMAGLPPEVAATWRGFYARALSGEALGFTFSETIDGAARHFDVQLTPVWHDANVVGALVISREVSARKAMENEIRASKAALSAVLDNTGDAIWSVDRDCRVVAFNQPFADGVRAIRGIDVGAGDDAVALFREPHRETWETHYRQALAGENVAFEFTSGDGRAWEVSLRPIGVGGAVIGACVQARDVTEKKRAEAALRASERKLYFADRMITVGTLAAGVAHEINNPLAYLYSHLELLAGDLERLPGIAAADRDELRETLAVLQDGAERIRVIVRDLGTFARAEDEREPSPIDVREVLDVALKMAAAQVRGRAEVHRHYGEVPPVLAHPARLGQVLLNLIVNAAQAIAPGEPAANRITLRTGTDAAGNAVIEVEDTGSGIAEELHSRIFDPFFTTKPVGTATGLGLSIGHGIVTALGGELSVRSSPGAGAVFRVVLPPARSASSGKIRVADAARPSRVDARAKASRSS